MAPGAGASRQPAPAGQRAGWRVWPFWSLSVFALCVSRVCSLSVSPFFFCFVLNLCHFLCFPPVICPFSFRPGSHLFCRGTLPTKQVGKRKGTELGGSCCRFLLLVFRSGEPKLDKPWFGNKPTVFGSAQPKLKMGMRLSRSSSFERLEQVGTQSFFSFSVVKILVGEPSQPKKG